ncbi:hypothetical protein P692DRAFT_201796506 [Suillus brevipes Sb2]|nr:hypothetical protein P692DRAFT_201796506 [Suillus brevipes Sb2]
MHSPISSTFLSHRLKSATLQRDIVPDEYFDPPSSNPDSQQAAAAVPATGEHGGDRSCFCF